MFEDDLFRRMFSKIARSFDQSRFNSSSPKRNLDWGPWSFEGLFLPLLISTFVWLMLKFQFAHSLIPHPAKAHRGGEDALLIDHQTSSFVIADGVGGWEAEGINAGIFSRELCTNSRRFIEESRSCCLDPLQMMDYSWRHSQCPGSSTMLAGVLAHNHLRFANIGDSSFCLYRRACFLSSSPAENETADPTMCSAVLNTCLVDCPTLRCSNLQVSAVERCTGHPSTSIIFSVADNELADVKAQPGNTDYVSSSDESTANNSILHSASSPSVLLLPSNISSCCASSSSRVPSLCSKPVSYSTQSPPPSSSSLCPMLNGNLLRRAASVDRGLAVLKASPSTPSRVSASEWEMQQDASSEDLNQVGAESLVPLVDRNQAEQANVNQAYCSRDLYGFCSSTVASSNGMASLNPNQSLPRENESAEADDPAQLVRSVSMQLGVELLDGDCNWQRRCNNVVVDSNAPKDLVDESKHHELRLVFRCAAQQHSFNVPHQLTSLRTLLEIEDSVQVDVPDAALVGNICLREGDVLIAASDGVWDNLFESHIHDILHQRYDPNDPSQVAAIARDIAHAASVAAQCSADDPHEPYYTPFALEALKHELHALSGPGGKLDDISVVVGQAMQQRQLRSEEKLVESGSSPYHHINEDCQDCQPQFDRSDALLIDSCSFGENDCPQEYQLEIYQQQRWVLQPELPLLISPYRSMTGSPPSPPLSQAESRSAKFDMCQSLRNHSEISSSMTMANLLSHQSLRTSLSSSSSRNLRGNSSAMLENSHDIDDCTVQ